MFSLLFSGGKTCSLNSHYNPYYFNCDYCNVPYHYIGKLEHWDEDIANIAKVEICSQISFLVISYNISEGKSQVTAGTLWGEKESNQEKLSRVLSEGIFQTCPKWYHRRTEVSLQDRFWNVWLLLRYLIHLRLSISIPPPLYKIPVTPCDLWLSVTSCPT